MRVSAGWMNGEDLARIAVKKRTRWGNWRLSKRTLMHVPTRYWVDLDSMITSAACLDWIMQLTAKTWMSPQDKVDLIEAIRATVNPQAHLCSWGITQGRGAAR